MGRRVVHPLTVMMSRQAVNHLMGCLHGARTRRRVPISKFPGDRQIGAVIESRCETDPITRRGDFFPVLAGRYDGANQCTKAPTEKGAYAGYRAGANDVTLSATISQRAAGSPGGSADTGTDRRIDSSRTRTFTYVELRDFLAQYRYGLGATWNV